MLGDLHQIATSRHASGIVFFRSIAVFGNPHLIESLPRRSFLCLFDKPELL
jgi:hypothetical protein